MRTLLKDWRSRFPWIEPVAATYRPEMPKASTVYCGALNKFNLHLFLEFQHNAKPWAVGDFTVNVVFSRQMGAPSRWIGRDLEEDPEGSHRLGTLLFRKDKWWALRPNDNRYGIVWRPVSYASANVVEQAVEDVSKDVEQFFEKINQRAG